MFGNTYRGLETVTRAFNIHEFNGDMIPIYLNKLSTSIARDRVAVSVISDETMEDKGKFTNTLIQVTSNNTYNAESEEARMAEEDLGLTSTSLFKSSNVMSYEALMALIYKLRIDGYVVNDIANISSCTDGDIISVEELNSDIDIVRITASDRLATVIESIIERNEYRINERHTCRILTVCAQDMSEHDLQELINVAFKRAFKLVEMYAVSSEDGNNYGILASNNVACVKSGNTITVAAVTGEVDCEGLQVALKKLLDKEGVEYRIKTTGELIML